MASLARVETILNALPVETRRIVIEAFRAFLEDLRLGHPADQEPMTNFAGHFYEVTTASNAGDEFTIAHQFGTAPYLLLPVLPLDIEGAQTVPLTVSRVADDKRIYLTSSTEDATIVVGVEG